MTSEEVTTWQSYEDVARFLLRKLGDQLGLGLATVEGKQKLIGDSGTEWEVDGKAVRADDGAIIVVECRRYPKSRLNQGQVAHLAYEIGDVGASGAIVVTPIGLQRGARLIAERENIKTVHLDADSTTEGYLLKFLGSVVVGPRAATVTVTGHAPTVTITPAEPDPSQ